MNSYFAYALADLYLLIAAYFTYSVFRTSFRVYKAHLEQGFEPTALNVLQLAAIFTGRSVLQGLQWPKFFFPLTAAEEAQVKKMTKRRRKPAKRKSR